MAPLEAIGISPKLATKKDIKIANPPLVGIGTLLTRLALGLSTAPTRKAKSEQEGLRIRTLTKPLSEQGHNLL